MKTHPGGDLPLLNFAGQDVTYAYIALHPPAAWNHLDKFFNGYYLKDYTVSDVSKDCRKLYSEFKKMGLFEKKGHGVLISLIFIAMFGLMGFLWIQSGWLGQDSGHYQIMINWKFNRYAQILTSRS
ncbi:putative acyl-CoA 6-desaturase [Helianthus annuus]|nr:putative acyl-CoA 6-desaturase [Helianthus annuus]